VISLSERKTVVITEFRGSYNIGAFGIATDKYAIMGVGFRGKDLKDMEEALSAPVITKNINGDPIIGVMLSGNSNGLLVPDNVYDRDLEDLAKRLEGIEVKKISFSTYENTLGNLILANDKGAVVHSQLYKKNRKVMEVIEQVLGVEVQHYDFFTPVIRSMVVANNRGALVSPLLNEEEIDFIKSALKLERIGKGTGNMGSPFVGSCYIANSNGMVVGLKTTGPEIQRAYEILL